jgi:glycosyltransferase involved in cell wall biosynthesis
MSVRVGLVIAAWDAERFLGEALASVAAQTRPPDEVVLVDDGSTDGTAALAESWADRLPELRVLRRAHEGIGASRNAGIAAVTGDLVCFLDADDLWLPAKVERQVAAFAADPALEAVCCLVDEFTDPSAAAATVAVRAPRAGLGGALPSATMLRRSVIDRLGSFSSARAGEWVEWWARARADGAAETTVPEVLVRRRIHDANNSAQEAADGHAAFLAAARAHRQGRASS